MNPYSLYLPKNLRSLKPDQDRALALSVTLTLALLIALGVPLAAILPLKYVTQLPIQIIVPYYVFPDPGAWEPLYDAVIRHKELNFTVILNPSSGPGTPPLPGNQYIDAISRLNRLPNVKTVGYVGTKGGTRENKTVNDEIETYAGWSRKSGLGLHGIFFDQTPIVDSMEMRHYLKNISATVKHSKAFLEPKMVIHNPGKIPNANLTGPYVDITIVFEGECADIPKHEVMKPELAKLPARRENYGIVVHSVPSKIKWPGLRRIVNSAKKDVEYLYVTDRRENPYDGLSGIWGTFLDLTW